MNDWGDITGAHYVMSLTAEESGRRGRKRRLRPQRWSGRPSQAGGYALLLIFAPLCFITAALFLIGALTDPSFNTGWGLLVGVLFLVLGALSLVMGIRELRPRGHKKSRTGFSPKQRKQGHKSRAPKKRVRRR